MTFHPLNSGRNRASCGARLLQATQAGFSEPLPQPFLGPWAPHTSIPRAYSFFVLKTKLPIEKQMLICRFYSRQILQYQGVQDSGEELRLGLMPRTQLCNQPRAWRPSPLKGPFLVFFVCSNLPGTYSCLIFYILGRQPPRWRMVARVMLVLKCVAFNNPAGTYSSCCIRIQLENVEMNCCRLENQLGKRGRTSGVTLRIWKFILHI